jgi:hypothetical protein
VIEIGSSREAKTFLAGRIAAEAERHGTPLTEVERKMLYFSETGWTLPDMPEVKSAFDQHYDRAAYEKKIKALVRRYQARSHSEDREEFDAWNRAIRALRKEDHYVLTMISGVRGPMAMADIWITALVVVAVMLIAMYLASRH